jgi:hypothetical protein
VIVGMRMLLHFMVLRGVLTSTTDTLTSQCYGAHKDHGRASNETKFLGKSVNAAL